MTDFGTLQDTAARAALKTFGLFAPQYFYEDQKSGERYSFQCIERTIEIVETDKNDVTLVRSGKGFLVPRSEFEMIDAWRKEKGIDVQKEPTPFGGDVIVRVIGEETERYEITYREPFSVIGTNAAMIRINTILVNTNRVNKDG